MYPCPVSVLHSTYPLGSMSCIEESVLISEFRWVALSWVDGGGA